jgi:hypothetical protein
MNIETAAEHTARTVRDEARLQWRENKAGIFLAAAYVAWIIGLLMGG